MMCARTLIKQGFHVSIFDDMKDKGTNSIRNLEEILEYLPIICENFKDHPLIKLFSDLKIHFGIMNLEIETIDKDFKFLSEDFSENAEKKFFEIITEIINTGIQQNDV